MEFFMPMIPPTATAQEKQVRVVKGKPVFYDPPEVKAARAKLTAHLASHAPQRPLEGAVRLGAKWCFPRGQHADGEYRTSRPDTDNLQKLLKDCMTAAGFWKDDAQVAAEICEKFWAEVPGIYVCVVAVGTKADCQTGTASTAGPEAPLTLEELRKMDGEPVWISPVKETGKIPSRWMLVSGYNSDKDIYLFAPQCNITQGYDGNAYGKTWLAYRRKPEEVTHYGT